MASIYLRGKTYWIIYYANGQKVQRSLKARDRTVANYRKNQIEKDLAERRKPLQIRSFPIQEALEEYLATAQTSQTPRSFNTTKGRLVPFLESLEVNHLHDITAAHVQSYITKKIRQDEIVNKTANHILTTIKAFLNYCVKHEYLGRNPAVAVEHLKVPKIPGKHLSLDEIHRLLEAAKQNQDSRFHPMVATAVYAGLRLGELFALEWEDVDSRRKEIMIKDKPELGLRTKTGKFRTVPLHDKFKKILEPYRKSSGFCFFPGKELRRTTTDFNRHFKQILKAAKMPRGTNWLTLRRTFGSQLAQAGVDLLRIQTWMGHADPRLTIEHYAHLKPGHDEEINKFPA